MFRPMKPETIIRRAAKHERERAQRRVDLVTRLAETAAEHEQRGDIKTAAHYADMFVEALDGARA
jgi:hypothetical protein